MKGIVFGMLLLACLTLAGCAGGDRDSSAITTTTAATSQDLTSGKTSNQKSTETGTGTTSSVVMENIFSSKPDGFAGGLY